MTKKDFILIANAINKQYNNDKNFSDGLLAIENIVIELSKELKTINPLFDKGRFLDASLKINK